MKCCYVYIMTNKSNKVLYIGFTNDLYRKVQEHRNKEFIGFTNFYNVNRLVYFEKHPGCDDAMKREKQLKKWNREWKERLFFSINPEWKDLSENFRKKLTPDEVMKVLLKNDSN
jgi:putative endonuclease